MNTPLATMKEALEAATPGPWQWHGWPHNIYLWAPKTPAGDYVMQFARNGMNSAQPVFPVDGAMAKAKEILWPDGAPRDNTGRIREIPNPNAHLIANAPTWLAELIAEVERLEKDAARWQAIRAVAERGELVRLQCTPFEPNDGIVELGSITRLAPSLDAAADAAIAAARGEG